MNVSIKRIKEITEGLCRFENRIAGTKTERDAANYLKGILTDIGYDVIEHEFPIIAWEPKSLTIELVNPELMAIDCALFPNSPSYKGRVTLVTLESEQVEKIEKPHTFGYTEWGESLYTSPETPYNRAIDLGLDGLIISSPDDGELLKVRVGNHGRQLRIPVISVSKETGESLKKMMKSSQVTLDIKCTAERNQSQSYNLETVLDGTNPDFDIILSAHYDAWFSGAADNAAPAAIVIEVARQLRELVKNGGSIRRTVRFLLFGAEEGGAERAIFWLNGSRNYVESQQTINHIGMIVNLDSIGYKATNYIATTYELMNFSKFISKSIEKESRFNHYSPPASGSDHWFFTTKGIPTIYLISWPSHLYHTQKDLPESLDFESIKAYAEHALSSIIEFSNATLLPLDIMALIEFLKATINEAKSTANSSFEFHELFSLLTEILEFKKPLERHAQDILETKDKNSIANLNSFLITTSCKINRFIGLVAGVHEARYMSHLELIHDYIAIDSVLKKFEEMPFMKIHPRTLAGLREYDDTPSNLVHITSVAMDMRKECNRLASLVNDEITTVASSLREIRDDLEKLLT